jgi:hypothetical protein
MLPARPIRPGSPGPADRPVPVDDGPARPVTPGPLRTDCPCPARPVPSCRHQPIGPPFPPFHKPPRFPFRFWQEGWTGLILGGVGGNEAVMQLLLEHKADVNAANQVPGGLRGRAAGRGACGRGGAWACFLGASHAGRAWRACPPSRDGSPPPARASVCVPAQSFSVHSQEPVLSSSCHPNRPIRSCECNSDRPTGPIQWMMIPPGPLRLAGSERTAIVLFSLSHLAGIDQCVPQVPFMPRPNQPV